MTDDPRLPRTLVPEAYRIRLELDLERWRFHGALELDAQAPEATDVLVLHASELDLHDAVVRRGSQRHAATVSLDPDRERVELALDTAVDGAITVQCAFDGAIGDQLAGLYRATTDAGDGPEGRVVATQLFATEARRVFPCVDEPAAKATFELTAVVPEGLLCASNTPVAAERLLGDGRREVRFAPTIVMSTYLLALVVGDLVRTDPVDVDGVELAVVCTSTSTHLASLALRAGAFALRFFRDYFGLEYPGEKLDLVAIPNFAYGAMENLGCIVFREQALLVDEQDATPAEVQLVAGVVCHEIAHMWFGDLVTMAWWEGLWLNEAFATFMASVCVDAFRPDLHVWLTARAQLEFGFETDELHSTRPIEYEVHTPAEALGMADVITYVKGAGVLRMLEQYLGPATFRDGVRRYLRTHAYANARTSDLWEALEAASGEPVAAIMTSWVFQGGHPVVWVRDGTLSQRPFALGAPSGRSNIGTRWKVPVRLRDLDAGASSVVLDEGATLAAGGAVVANTGDGFYRTGYDAGALATLQQRFGELAELEHAALLADTWALARAGQGSVRDVLGLASALGPVLEPAAWVMVARILSTLVRVADDALRPALRAHAAGLAAPLHETLGFDAASGEDSRGALVRPVALRLAGALGADPAVRREALARFDDGRDVGPVADAIVAIVAATARSSDRAVLLERMERATDPQVEERYRSGLADFEDLASCLELLVDAPRRFRTQDLPFVLRGLVENPVGGIAVWEALTQRWDEVVAPLPPQLHFPLLRAVPSLFTDERVAEEAADFVRSHAPPVAERLAEQSLELLALAVEFRRRALPELHALFD